MKKKNKPFKKITKHLNNRILIEHTTYEESDKTVEEFTKNYIVPEQHYNNYKIPHGLVTISSTEDDGVYKIVVIYSN